MQQGMAYRECNGSTAPLSFVEVDMNVDKYKAGQGLAVTTARLYATQHGEADMRERGWQELLLFAHQAKLTRFPANLCVCSGDQQIRLDMLLSTITGFMDGLVDEQWPLGWSVNDDATKPAGQ